MQIIKQKTILSLKAIREKCGETSEENLQEGQENNISVENQHYISPQANEVKRFDEFLEHFSSGLTEQQKLLTKMCFTSELANEMSKQNFQTKINEQISKIEESSKLEQEKVQEKSIANSRLQKSNKVKNNIRKTIRKTEPAVQSHPEYYRVDQEIAHKLFEHYKNLPLGVGKSGTLSFQEKQQFRSCLNYHKILQIFKDAGLTLQINQKLLILRTIKKISFNQNMVNEEEFTKIYKYLVFGLGYKEKVFGDLILRKAIDGSLYEEKKKKKSGPKSLQKVYRFKTENNIRNQDSSMLASKKNVSIYNQPKQAYTKPRIMSLNTESQQISDSKISKLTIKNKRPLNLREGRSGSTGSYLMSAMQAQKISKITWENLFAMKENNMHYHISIPDIVRGIDDSEFDY